jgi:hypothetical protein
MTHSNARPRPDFFLLTQQLSSAGWELAPPEPPREMRLWMTEKSMWYTARDLERLGIVLTDFAQLDPSSADVKALIGREVEVECRHKMYQGADEEQWSVARQAPQRLETSSLRELNEKLGHLLNNPPPIPARAKRPPAPPVEEGDAPPPF